MKTYIKTLSLLSVAGIFLAISAGAQTFTKLYGFTGANDGHDPFCGLTVSGNILYGTCYNGGTNGNGCVFKINSDGTGFKNINSFTGSHDGANPYGGVVLAGGCLF